MATLSSVAMSEVKLEDKSESFSNVPLDVDHEKGKKVKKPRRIIHFSDGVLEEYSTDEEEEEKKSSPTQQVDPAITESVSAGRAIQKTLGWFSWLWYYTGIAACRSLSGADFLGEKLAWFFGITSPKYQFAIDEYNRLKEEEEEEKKREEREEAARLARENQQISELEGGPQEKGDTQPLQQSGKGGYDNLAMKY